MRIFKFGGASVKDAEGVENVVKVLRETGHENTLVVVSAMGKTTNAMEAIVNAYFNDKGALPSAIQEVIDYHSGILTKLFKKDQHPVFNKLKVLFDEVQGFLVWNKSPNYNFVYDQVVGYGELASSTIISAYMNEIGVQNSLLDIRDFINCVQKHFRIFSYGSDVRL